MNEDLHIKLTQAIHDIYNSKFDQAEEKFTEMKSIYPKHPLPYFLMGLSNWWKMMPYKEGDERIEPYAKVFIKEMETSIEKADEMYERNQNNLEAVFFLTSAHSMLARYYAENNKNKLKIVNHARIALQNLKKIIDHENELDIEFLFGTALFNYYGEWFRDEYPWLKPLMVFFPKGDKKKGLEQLTEVSNNAFWTRAEAQYFLMKIYFIEEDDDAKAYPIAKYLYETFPDNPYFHRLYTRLSYTLGKKQEAKKLAEELLYRVNIGMPGYEEISGRYASFIVGRQYYLNKDYEKAKQHYKMTLVFGEKSEAQDQNYYLQAATDLATMADNEKDIPTARSYYKLVEKYAPKKNPLYKQAKEYLKRTKNAER
ncbi:MAG: tol-pal system protein YbgF [Cytophagaceae bacterium]|nr:tol-pal system protein YbgF [Cytophagaceae bacterium]MDW8455189.1 tol-pal system protein YbgF [Cytophagaceae bacterium]